MKKMQEAQMICFECPVRKECDDYRSYTDSRYGIWGAKLQQPYDKGE